MYTLKKIQFIYHQNRLPRIVFKGNAIKISVASYQVLVQRDKNGPIFYQRTNRLQRGTHIGYMSYVVNSKS